MITDLTSKFTSLERLKVYETLPQEAAHELGTDLSLTQGGWPKTPTIEFRDASLRYAPELPLALKDLNFTIEVPPACLSHLMPSIALYTPFCAMVVAV